MRPLSHAKIYAIASTLMVLILGLHIYFVHFSNNNQRGVQRLDHAVKQRLNAPLERQEIALPDPWNQQNETGIWRYTVPFTLAQIPSESWAAYIPRAGNRLKVSLNGQLIAQWGELTEARHDYTEQPHWLALPGQLLKLGSNTLDIDVAGERGRYAGLSAIQVGSATALQPQYEMRHIAQREGSFALSVVSAIFAVLGLAIWWLNKDRAYLIFGLACLFSSLRSCYALVTHLPMDFRLWSFFMDMFYSSTVSCLALFYIETLPSKYPQRWRVGVYAFLGLSLILIALHTSQQSTYIRQMWTQSLLLMVFLSTVYTLAQWLKSMDAKSTALAIAVTTGFGLGVHDHILVFHTKDGFGGFGLARYAMLVFLLGMGWVLAERMQSKFRQQLAIRRELSAALKTKTAALAHEFGLRQKRELEQAHLNERQKLLHDLHDGLGLQLNGLLGLVENHALDRTQLKAEVRTALDQLRLLVDGTETFDGSLPELIGQIRHRIGLRLQRCQIELLWDLPEFPETIHQYGLVQSSALSMQRLLFELSSNVIKHANASTVTVCWSLEIGENNQPLLALRFTDNGKGFHADSVQYTATSQAFNDPQFVKSWGSSAGLGLRSIERRVQDLGAQYQFSSQQDQGTSYSIAIPLERMCLLDT